MANMQLKIASQVRLIYENDDYAEAKSYLKALSRWHERWALAYLKEYFFADMSSTKRGESINSLLKRFIDCKTRLTEFLAAFKCALNLCEEAEHISAYNAKDAYACKEITDYDDVHCFKLSRYERPDVIHQVYYDSHVLSCCCRNLEFAGIQKDLPELELAKDYVNFYSRSQLQTSGILASHESSSKSDS
ncbi:7599_t:CDS:2 [Dentiscutata heterogama]|uniref:7599_t:CDS:1 n=1 Tax=Dentiscutata heterogama TaxID=1316150 RepID=A0ACA9KW66_9GLOM|nr:7599_t:CDS:2 [Dentiscutata heterogama]